MKRIFAAIDISDEARSIVTDYIESLREEFPQIRVGWERAEKLHLTLKFFGDVDEKQLTELTSAIEETSKQISDFKLQITKTGVFASKRNARILWLGLKDEAGSLQKINEILETECEKKGFSREKRNFKAHLTIARLREPQKSSELIRTHMASEFTAISFTVGEIIVFQSELQRNGSRYTPIFRDVFS